MKTAIYIEDGVIQMVITAESEFEKNAISNFEEKSLNVQILHGSFYDCRGGFVRQRNIHCRSNMPYACSGCDRSIILRINKEVNHGEAYSQTRTK